MASNPNYQKEYAAKHAERKRAATKKWRLANLERSRQQCRDYYNANKEKLSEYNRKYYKANQQDCIEYAREYRKQNPLAHMKSQYRHVAGIPHTKATSCEICGTDKKIVMDHCHELNVFRGWICNDCNLALGFSSDSSDRLRKMADYLDSRGENGR